MIKKIKVLLVDDDFINLKLLQLMLKKNESIGEMVEARNGLEALTVLKVQPDVDLILLDIKMPIMDGIECLINLQSMQDLKNIPVIILTTDESKKREAFENGAFDFLLKPIRENDLKTKISTIAKLF
jgi:putative two-component system response regulator